MSAATATALPTVARRSVLHAPRATRRPMRVCANIEAPATGTTIAPELKSLEIMRKFSEQYAQRTGTYFCTDLSVTAVVIKGLAEHKDELGAPLCPCRHYDDKAAEAEQGFWNCPCVPMRERKECHCMLFLTPEDDFVGEAQTVTLDELVELTKDL
ncbi:Ferredoxin-thioredoxin reductase catalytic chain [Chlorella vulgaris]